MERHIHRRLVFFGGKGGVGKTTCAAAFAWGAARAGKRTLLVSTDPAHNLGDLFGCAIGGEEREIAEGLWALEIDAQREVDRYLRQVKENLRRLLGGRMSASVERHLELTRQSPGTAEAALFDGIVDIVRRAPGAYDLVVFDTAPTGHTLRLLSLPEVLGAWIDGLLRRRKEVTALHHRLLFDGGEPAPDPVAEALAARREAFAEVRAIFLDPEQTAFVFVLVPEKLPIHETAKAIAVLEGQGIPCPTVIVNRLLPPGDGSAFLAARRAQEAKYLAEIARRFANKERITLPLLPRDIDGPEALAQVAERLFAPAQATTGAAGGTWCEERARENR